MGEHAHTIGKHAFELHCHLDRQRAQAVQDRVSSIFYGRLTAVMDQVLSAVLPMGQRMRLQRLELNLGTLRYSHLEEDLENRLREALMEALRDRLAALQHEQPHAGDELVPAQQSRLQLLAYFLEHGALPWWEQRDDFGSLDQLLESLIREEPTALNALIRDIGRSVVVRQRLVRQFSLRLIEALVKVLEPQHAAFIVSYVQDLKSLHREEPIVPASAEEFERSVWELVLAYIIEERGSVFNAKSFVKFNLRHIATRFMVDFGTLLDLLHEATTLQEVPPHLQTTLLDLIRLIREEHFRDHGQAGPPAAIAPEGPSDTQRPLLQYYLTFGSLPWWAPSWREQDVETMVQQWAAKRPRDLATIIREHVQDPERLARHAANTWSTATRQHVLKALYPRLAPDISDWVALVASWQRERATGRSAAGAQPAWQAIWTFLLHPQEPVRKLKELVVRSIDRMVLPHLSGRSQWLRSDQTLGAMRALVARDLLERARAQGTSSRMQKALSALELKASKPSWPSVLETTLQQVASRHASGRMADPLWSYGALARWLVPLLQQLRPTDRLPTVLAKVQEVVRLQAREHGRGAAQVWQQLRAWVLPLEGAVRYYGPFAQLRGALALYPEWNRIPDPATLREHAGSHDPETPSSGAGLDSEKRSGVAGATPESAENQDQISMPAGASDGSGFDPLSGAGPGHEEAADALRKQTLPPVFDEQEVLWLLIHFQLFWQQTPNRQAALAYVQRVLRTVAGRYRLPLASVVHHFQGMVPAALASGQVGNARQAQLDALDALINEAADLAATEAEQEAFEELMARVNVRELVDALFSLRLQLDQQRSGWSGAEWLERLVRRLARKYRVRYAVMLRAIRKAMEKTVDLQRLLTLEPELQQCLDLLAEEHPLQQPITAYGEVARLDVLEFFLRYGALPWWAAAATGPDRMPETLRALTASVPHEVKAMLERSGNRPEVRERLIKQFPETQLPEVLAVFPIAGQSTFLLGIQALLLLPTSTFRLPVSRSVWRYQVWEHALKLLVADPGAARPDGNTLLEKLLDALALRVKLPVRELYAALDTVQTALPEAGKAELFRQLRQRGSRWRPVPKSPGEREKEPPVREAHQELQEAEAAMRQAADQPSGPDLAGQRSELFLLKHYLVHGRFPDWAGEYPFHSVGEVFAWLLLHNPEALEGVMRDGLSRWSSRERIAGDFSTESLEALLNLLLGDQNRFIPNYLNDLWTLIDALPGRGTKRQWRQRKLLNFALGFAVTVSAANFNPTQFLKSLLMRLAVLENQPYEALLKTLVRELGSHPLALNSGLPATLLSLLTAAGGAVTMEGAATKAPTEQPTEPEAEPAAPEETPLPEPEEELPTDALFVANAGLVLLWPYLTRYLAQLELLQAQEFKSAKAARRAVHLLQHLVTGKQEKVPEFELVLNKVLCGLDTADPMENRIRFKKAEIELSGSLLDGVIQHWSALGKTSVEGLRNSFLIREGKLSFGEDHWLLQVEQRGWDVLLDRLPWSISRIKLPWMEHQLIVNWR